MCKKLFIFKLFKKINIKANYIAILATCGTVTGHLFKQSARLLRKRGISINYFNSIETVDNYFAIFKRETVKEEENKLLIQYKKGTQISKDINKHKIATTPKGSFFGCIVSCIFRTFLPIVNLGIRVHKKDCVGCGVCVNNCQLKAIYLKNNKAKVKCTECQNCQGCINICPKKAISFMRVNKKVRRYIHPNSNS